MLPQKFCMICCILNLFLKVRDARWVFSPSFKLIFYFEDDISTFPRPLETQTFPWETGIPPWNFCGISQPLPSMHISYQEIATYCSLVLSKWMSSMFWINAISSGKVRESCPWRPNDDPVLNCTSSEQRELTYSTDLPVKETALLFSAYWEIEKWRFQDQ